MYGFNSGIASTDGDLYIRLRRLAAYYMRMERRGHTLQPTALVHEAYLRVYGRQEVALDDSRQTLYVLVRAMREILINHARKRGALKRMLPVEFEDQSEDRGYAQAAEILALHLALEELGAIDARRARVVELRYYAGFTESEVADLLGVSRETVKLDWRFAKAWLRARLERAEAQAMPCGAAG